MSKLDALERLAKQLEQPVIKRATLNTAIPFVISSREGIIPFDTSPQDPLISTYDELASIAYIQLDARWDAQSKRWVGVSAPTEDTIGTFIGHVLQYYVIRSVDWMQYPIQSVSYERGKGTTVNQAELVSVPDEEEYSTDKLNTLWRVMGLTFTPNAGEDDWMWREHKLKVPRGTLLSVTESLESYFVRFEREPDFYVEFKITPGGHSRGVGTLPAHFQPSSPQDIQDAYCYFVMINMEFNWYGKDHSNTDAYAEWSRELFAGLQRKLVLPDTR